VTWWTGGALGFDLETDGKEPLDARIITAAHVSLTPGVGPQAMELMLKPERDIPDEAVGVHGITTERAREEGTDRAPGVALIAATIADLAGPERPLVGHNASFDLTILDREMRRTGVGFLTIVRAHGGLVQMVIGDDAFEPFPVIDTYVLDKAVDRYRRGSRKLEAVAAHYGVPMAEGSAHGATADVFAGLRIAFRISRRSAAAVDYIEQFGGPPMSFQMHPFMRHYAGRKDPLDLVRSFAAISAMSLPELHAAQVRWAREQADGLRDYFISQDKKGEAATVDGSWPVRTLTDGASPVEDISTELV
jgi:DNA polymerase III subunit epsilon